MDKSDQEKLSIKLNINYLEFLHKFLHQTFKFYTRNMIYLQI